MEMNRRGVFFTIIAVILAGFAVLSFFELARNSAQHEQAVSTRIETLDNFMTDAKKDFERAVQIGTFRSVLSLAESDVDSGAFIDDVDAAFSSAMVNATYGNRSLTSVKNATLMDWKTRVQTQASAIGLTLTVTILKTSIQQVSPWTVRGFANATLFLSDDTGLANFTTNYSTSSDVSIIGFEDPLYALNTYGRLTNTINVSPYSDFIVGNDTTNLMLEVTKGYYIEHNDSPSYLMRLEGNLSASPFGIESLVNLTKVAAQDVPIYAKSVVDSIYFSNESPAYAPIAGMPSWFYLDATHALVYN